MAYRKQDSQIQDLYKSFGGAQFTDILNRLWMMGVDPNKLKDALAQPVNGVVGTNDPTDIITRLLNKNIVTLDQIKAAPGLPVPQIPGEAWPFQPDHKDQNGAVIPVNTNQYDTKQPGGGYLPPNATPTVPTAPTQVPIPQATLPTGTTGTAKKVVQKVIPTDTKKEPDTSTAAGRAEYEKEHFSTMLWVKDVPDLATKIEQAAREKWSPERFQGEIESTDWWKTHSDKAREYVKLRADDPTYQRQLGVQKDLASAYSQTFGVTLDDQTLGKLADQALQFGWDTNMLKKQVVNQAKYDPNQGGELGANIGVVKANARNYFVTMSDQDAFAQAVKLAGGDIDQNTLLGNMRAQAKAAWPSLSQLIDQGVAPRDAISNQINTAAQLLELDPNEVDPTNPKFHQMISATDDKGVARPMTVDETTKFVKSMDDYWKTDNAASEVGQKVTSLAKFMGRTV